MRSVKLTNQGVGFECFMCGRGMQMKMHLFIKQTTKVPSARHWHKREKTNSVSSNRMCLYLCSCLWMYLYPYRYMAAMERNANLHLSAVCCLTTYWQCTLGYPSACCLPTPEPLGSVGNFIDKHLWGRRSSWWVWYSLTLFALECHRGWGAACWTWFAVSCLHFVTMFI